MPIPASTASLSTDIPVPDYVTPASSRSVITWTSPGGDTINLTSGWTGNLGLAVGMGIKGFDAPPVDLQLDDLPALDGAAYRSIRAITRELFIPLNLGAANRSDYLTLKRDISRKLVTRQGLPGTLSVYEIVGDAITVRHIDCYYAGGMEGDEQTASNLTYSQHGLILRAPDPWWYGNAVNKDYSLAGTTPINFFTGKARGAPDELTGAFMPFQNLSTVWLATGAPQTISILGDVETWPIWTIVGKGGSKFTLNNLTTGKGLTLNYDFSVGDTVIIDTRPGIKTAVNSAGDNVWSHFDINPKLWEFMPGDNQVSFALTLASGNSATGVTGSIQFSYKPRYLGA